jgi:hypothetical protein
MDLKRRPGLRPKEKTAAALAGAREDIERAARDLERAAHELEERIAEMRRTRGEQLLGGDLPAIERARIASMLDAVRNRTEALGAALARLQAEVGMPGPQRRV